MTANYLPIFEIYKGGENVTSRFQDRAMSIIIELASGAGSGDSVDIVLDDRDAAISTPRVKDRLEVYLGYQGIGLAYMGSFEINSVLFSIQPRTIVVRGTAASSLNDLKSQKVEAFENKTIEEILATSAQKAGMKVDIHPAIASNKIPFLNNGQSLSHLVGKLEAHYGAVAKITDGKISLAPRGEGKSVSDFSMPTYVFRHEHFSHLEVLTESRGEYAKTKTSYFDKDKNERVYVEALSKITGLDTEAAHTITELYNSKDEAEAAAKSVQGQLDRSTGKISAQLAEGDPWVRDQQRIVVTGIRDGIDGSYLLDIVRHSYSKGGGLKTSFTGAAGINSLASDYAAATATPKTETALPSFLVIPGGGVAGMVLPKAAGAIPSLIGTPTPTTN